MGHNPEERFIRTGHATAMRQNWSSTIGFWGLRSRAEIMQAAGLDPVSKADCAVFYSFKSNHRLGTRDDTVRNMVRLAQGTLDSCARCLNESPQAYMAREVYRAVTDGSEPRLETMGAVANALGHRVGLLPVEVVLYYAAAKHLMGSAGLDSDGFDALSVIELSRLWDSHDLVVGLPEAAGYTSSHV